MHRPKSDIIRSRGYSFRYKNIEEKKVVDKSKSLDPKNNEDEDVQNLLSQINIFDNDLNKFLYSIENETREKSERRKEVRKETKSLIFEDSSPVNISLSSGEATNSIVKWLESIGKDVYIHEFLINGFDDSRFLKNIIEKEDLDCLGIYNDAEIIEVMEGVKKLPEPPQIEVNSMNEFNIKYVLKLCNLGIYFDTFILYCYDSFETLQNLNILSLLVLLDIKSIGHRKRIMYYINQGVQKLSVENNKKIKESESSIDNTYSRKKILTRPAIIEEDAFYKPKDVVTPIKHVISSISEERNKKKSATELFIPSTSNLSEARKKEIEKKSQREIDGSKLTDVSNKSNKDKNKISKREVDADASSEYSSISDREYREIPKADIALYKDSKAIPEKNRGTKSQTEIVKPLQYDSSINSEKKSGMQSFADAVSHSCGDSSSVSENKSQNNSSTEFMSPLSLDLSITSEINIKKRPKNEITAEKKEIKSMSANTSLNHVKSVISDDENAKMTRREEKSILSPNKKDHKDRKNISKSAVYDPTKAFELKDKKGRRSISSKIGDFFKKISNKNISLELEPNSDDLNILDLDYPMNLETTTVAARTSSPWAMKNKIAREDSETAKSLKNCNIWIHSQSQLTYGCVTIIAYFLGMYPVKNIKLKGRKLVEQPIQKLQVHKTGIEKMPEVIINISAFDIVCLSKQTNQKIVAHDMKTVFFCCQDLTDQRVFSLVYYEENKKTYLCSVFRCSNVKTCIEAVLAVGLAFKICSSM